MQAEDLCDAARGREAGEGMTTGKKHRPARDEPGGQTASRQTALRIARVLSELTAVLVPRTVDLRLRNRAQGVVVLDVRRRVLVVQRDVVDELAEALQVEPAVALAEQLAGPLL